MSNRNKIITLILAIAIIALCLITLKNPFSADKPKAEKDYGLLGRPLKVGIVSWPGYAGGIVANNGLKSNKQSVYWEKYNLLVEFVLLEDIDVRAKSFIRGGKSDVDIVWTTVDFWANELPGIQKGGVKALAFLQVDWSKGADAIVSDGGINSLEELANKKVSLASLTPSHWFYEYAMRNTSLNPQAINNLGKTIIGKSSSPDARQEFVAKNVDACVVWEPDIENALKERPNSKILVSTEKYNKLLSDLMVAREDFINEHPKVIQAFVDGWFDGVAKAKSDNNNTSKLIIDNEPLFAEIGVEKTKSILSKVQLTDANDNLEMFGLKGNKPIFDDLFRQASLVWLSRGFITDTLSPSKAYTTKFLTKYLKYSK